MTSTASISIIHQHVFTSKLINTRQNINYCLEFSLPLLLIPALAAV